MISQDFLRSIVHYDPDSGLFTWLGTLKRTVAGKHPGCRDSDGYTVFKIKGKMYKAHRLAWLYMYGSFPCGTIDHVNRVKSDNRIVNLRACSMAQNLKNRRFDSLPDSGARGVYRSGNKFRVRVSVGGRNKHFGTFSDLELAELVASEVRRRHHGEFFNAN